MKKIVVVGAGFGGLRTVLNLEKQFRNVKGVQLTLIDRHDYHLFAPNLFEVATADEELTSLRQLEKSVVLPLQEILLGTGIKFVQGELTAVNVSKKTLTVGRSELDYDYLVLALGSVHDYLHVDGAEQYALPLKSLPDAFRIRNAIEFAVQAHRLDALKPNLRIVVAGGGYTGVELAGELPKLVDFVCWKNSYPREKVEILMLEAAGSLMAGFDERLSRDACFRLRDIGVEVKLGRRLAKVDEHFLEFLGGERLQYDALIWCTGVRASALPLSSEQFVALDQKGRVELNEYFQVKNIDQIFVLGDMGCYLDKQGKPMPGTAQNAIDQAKYVAYALPMFMQNLRPRPFDCKKHGFIVNVGGKWAVLSIPPFYLTGFPAYFVDKLAHLRYYWSLVGFWKACRYAFREVRTYSQKD